MEHTPSQTIVQDAIDARRESGQEWTGTELGKQVEQDVQERMDELRDTFGDAVDDIAGDAMDEATGYKEAVQERIGQHTIGDTESEGAAGWNDKAAGNEVVMSETAADLEVQDHNYWTRVKAHEEQHQRSHAGTSTMETVHYIDHSGEMQEASVVGDLTERDAIRAANQPDNDLTEDYKEHARKGDEVVAIAGSAEVSRALKTGDADALQRVIIDKQRDKILNTFESSAPQTALAA